MKPYLSLCIICGDEGVNTLERLLNSVLDRREPLVDEIIIGFNGKDAAKFIEAFDDVCEDENDDFIDVLPATGVIRRDGARISYDIFKTPWTGDFSVARNETWKRATGEWVIWLDTDDVVANADLFGHPDGLPAIEACERDYGMPPMPAGGGSSSTLKDWLRSLPMDANAVLAPYDYTIDANGYVLTRQLVKRIVRKVAGHIWRNPIHEVLYPNGSVGEQSVQNLGLLVRHYPSEAVTSRVARNKDIVMKLEERPELIPFQDARHAYDKANAYVTLGDWNNADGAIKQAIAFSNNDVDTYTYRLARCGINLKVGSLESALSEALAAIGLRPTLADAYFAACEVFFTQAKFDAVIKFYELGASCGAQAGQLDQPLAFWVQPRAQASTAYLNLGQPEKALQLAVEAAMRYPGDALAQEVLRNAKQASGKAKAVEGYLDAVEYALTEKNLNVAAGLLTALDEALNVPTAFRGIESLPRYKVLRTTVKKLVDEGHAWGPSFQTDKNALGVLKSAFTDVRPVLCTGGPHQAIDARALHVHADQREYQLIEHKEVGTSQFALVRERDVSSRSFAFYCPHTVQPWKPSDLESKGLGGSEGSVAYLARELARRGHVVNVYAPGASSNPMTTKGVTERSIASFNHREFPGDVLIACRAPWVMRHPEHSESGARPVFTWHQDNGYDSQWSWTKEINDLLRGSLHVSKWARDGLAREIGIDYCANTPALNSHHVIGNGIDESCISWLQNPKHTRNLDKVIYASDPTRGLEPLLKAWPKIREARPSAELHVFCSFQVMLAMTQSAPGLPGVYAQQAIEQLMLTTPGVIYRGWAPHSQLIAEMQSSSVYAYPGGPMPEGFGVSLVQASAAGCNMVFPDAGALPEVLPTSLWKKDADKLRTDADFLAAQVVDALRLNDETSRRAVASETFAQHSWAAVAQRFLKAVQS